MSKKQRPERAAPPVGSKDFYEKVNPYWLDQAARRPRFSCTIQATSSKRARPEVNSWEWRDTLQKRGRVGPQGRKLDK